MDEYVARFLVKAYLKIIKTDGNEIITKKCIRRAWNDMLIGGRFHVNDFSIYIEGKKEGYNTKEQTVEFIFEKLKEKKYEFSNELIEEIKKGCFGDNECFWGYAQKVINMTFKYLYCVKSYFRDNFRIDFSKCHCPIDKNILDRIRFKYKWTQITRSQYYEIQDKIKGELSRANNLMELKDIGNLAFDFLKW